MNASDWITRSVSRLRPGSAPEANKTASTPGPRPLVERLEATLRRNGEALAPRALRRSVASSRSANGRGPGVDAVFFASGALPGRRRETLRVIQSLAFMK